jgi:DNA topoisomerase-1
VRANSEEALSRNGNAANIRGSVTSAKHARAAGLVYVSDSDPGIRRVGRQRFRYLNADQKTVRNKKELQRIGSLAIPPAYTDVWICPDSRGHLQATGRDARGRKQYRYHADWRRVRDGTKFDRMVEFGEALPRLRRRLRKDLDLPGLPREKVLALVVSLLDATRVRIGNPEYARDNNSFGLTTLRNRHVSFIRDGRALLIFRGKGGQEHEITLDNPRIVKIVRKCQQLPGQQLFQYVDDAGERHVVTSEEVNEYLRETMGEEFTAKDFRTWGATLLAIRLMASVPLPDAASERKLKTVMAEATRKVAGELRNTPAVCRKSYINPVVFEAWRSGVLHRCIDKLPAAAPRKLEQCGLRFLRTMRRSAGGRKQRQSINKT